MPRECGAAGAARPSGGTNVADIDVTAMANKVASDRETAERHAAAAQLEAKGLARDLAAAGVAVRDVGEILGISFQRAQQLITA
ncbi:hypothetical protein [Mycolicibacterium gadium]|uniref:Uncharacterized protein n=1 Tax=Mycolicibacterium gadium TaxID=1794 RepID=A0ABT6GIK0_MYCGU|nr:hypothetical protein [Mycolicibacterium gadium]MDG5481222.1 hypothetical protein [Mycolicibacterium gadium]